MMWLRRNLNGTIKIAIQVIFATLKKKKPQRMPILPAFVIAKEKEDADETNLVKRYKLAKVVSV